MADQLEPVISLVFNKMDDGTYAATMTLSGLPTEQVAPAALNHMQRLFCGQELEANDA